MPLKPDISIPAALATGTLVYVIYERGMPKGVDMRATDVGNDMLESTRKQNAWMAAATVAGISLIAKDPVIFIVGGVMVIAIDWVTRANIWANPSTNKVAKPGEGGSVLSVVPNRETAETPDAASYVS